MLREILFLAFFLASFAYSMWRGGAPERWAGVMMFAALVASIGVGVLHPSIDFKSVPMMLACVDAALACGLTTLAVRSNRLWLIPATACQILTTLGHIAKLIVPTLFPGGYALLITIWSWPMAALLIAGTYCHRKRLKAGQFVPPWKDSSLPAGKSRKLT